MAENYEQRVRREEQLHKQITQDRENRKAWDSLTPSQYNDECSKIDSIGAALDRAGLTHHDR